MKGRFKLFLCLDSAENQGFGKIASEGVGINQFLEKFISKCLGITFRLTGMVAHKLVLRIGVIGRWKGFRGIWKGRDASAYLVEYGGIISIAADT